MKTNPPDLYTLAHESWNSFYSLAAIARALSQFCDGSEMNEHQRETVGGLITAAEIVANHGERMTAAAREATPIPPLAPEYAGE